MKNGWAYIVEVEIEHRSGNGNFDSRDRDYIDGSLRQCPSDFNLHLALYLLENESLPSEMLEPVKQWARENKMLVYPRFKQRAAVSNED